MDWVSHDQVFAGKSVCWFFWVLSVVSETIYRVESETDPRMTHGENTLRQGEREWESGEREEERERNWERMPVSTVLVGHCFKLQQLQLTLSVRHRRHDAGREVQLRAPARPHALLNERIHKNNNKHSVSGDSVGNWANPWKILLVFSNLCKTKIDRATRRWFWKNRVQENRCFKKT